MRALDADITPQLELDTYESTVQIYASNSIIVSPLFFIVASIRYTVIIQQFVRS